MRTELFELAELSKNPAYRTETMDDAHAKVPANGPVVERYYPRLRAFAEAQGFRLVDEPVSAPDGGFPFEVSGATRLDEKWIWVRKTLPANVKFVVLIHEVAHAITTEDDVMELLPEKVHRALDSEDLLVMLAARPVVSELVNALSEAAAEAATFLVCQDLGFAQHISESYLGHVFGQSAPALIKASAPLAEASAARIVSALEQPVRLAA